MIPKALLWKKVSHQTLPFLCQTASVNTQDSAKPQDKQQAPTSLD